MLRPYLRPRYGLDMCTWSLGAYSKPLNPEALNRYNTQNYTPVTPKTLKPKPHPLNPKTLKYKIHRNAETLNPETVNPETLKP